MSKRLLVALAGLTAFAAQALDLPPVGDPDAGAGKAATCAACHGMDGNSPAGEWPSLAGQHADYGFRHTVLVRDGGRENLTMLPFVQGLSDQDIADISAFYARQTIMAGVADDSPIVGRDDQTYAGLGARLYQGGKPDVGVPACAACHGPSGRGIPGAGYPALAGQHAEYTGDRLRFFHGGGHYGDANDPSTIMTTIAGRLDLVEIDALSTYIAGLHRNDPRAQAMAATMTAPAGAVPAAPAPTEDGSVDATDAEPAMDDETTPADDDTGDEAGT